MKTAYLKGHITAAIIAMTLIGCRIPEKSTTLDSEGKPQIDELTTASRPASHGMIVFGDQGQYLYHLPMWHGIHAWQIIINGSLDEASSKLYLADKEAGSPLNSLAPAPFALANLAPNFQISGDLFHGHFEQGGTPLEPPSIAQFIVNNIVMVKPLKMQEQHVEFSKYRVFGNDNEWYAAHLATGRPDFDHILKLVPQTGILTQTELAEGTTFHLKNVGPTAIQRPVTGQTYVAVNSEGREVAFQPTVEFYFSEADLGQ